MSQCARMHIIHQFAEFGKNDSPNPKAENLGVHDVKLHVTAENLGT